MNRLAAAAGCLVLVAAGAALAQVRPSGPPTVNPTLTMAPVTQAEIAALRNELKQTQTELAQLRSQYQAHMHTYPRGDDGSCAQKKPFVSDGVSVGPPQTLGIGPCYTSKPAA